MDNFYGSLDKVKPLMRQDQNQQVVDGPGSIIFNPTVQFNGPVNIAGPLATVMDWQDSIIAIQNAPPGAPGIGDRYIVGSAPSGAWVGHADEIAMWVAPGLWQYFVPNDGWTLKNLADNTYWGYDGNTSVWRWMGEFFQVKRVINVAQQGAPYTSLAAALVAAVALVPTATDPVYIYIAPGTYTEDNSGGALQIPTHVYVSGSGDPRAVRLRGNTAAQYLVQMDGDCAIGALDIQGGNFAAIRVNSGTQNFIFGIIFNAGQDGIAQTGVGAHAHVKDCEFYNQTATSFAETSAVGSGSRTTIESCDFNAPAGGNLIVSNNPIVVQDCSLVGGTAPAVVLFGSGIRVVNDTTVVGGTAAAIDINSSAPGMVVSCRASSFQSSAVNDIVLGGTTPLMILNGGVATRTKIGGLSPATFKGVFYDPGANQFYSTDKVTHFGDFQIEDSAWNLLLDVDQTLQNVTAFVPLIVSGNTSYLRLPRWTTAEETANTAAWGAAEEGAQWFNTTTKQFMGWNGTAAVILG